MRRREMLLATVAAAAAIALPSTGAFAATSEPTMSSEPYGLAISSDFPYTKKQISVLDSKMTYVDVGEGPVVLFLHGNPTSSYLWRNVIPHLVAAGYRAIAPDLIGMGDSGKPDIPYTFDDHAAYLDTFIEATNLRDMTLVVHDWGSVLGMRYARTHPKNVRGLAFMEAIIPPGMPAPSYEAMGEVGELFRNMRTAGVGEEMVLQNNFFVEKLLPEMGVARTLTEQEMAHYRRPYPTPQSRLPTLQWPREIPIAGQPKATHDVVIANGKWLTQNNLPKLYFYASPGALNPAPVAEWVIGNVANLEARFLGHGVHFLQEDHPDLIGTSIVDWLRRI